MRIVIHIGANKAASTTLQNHLFSTNSNIHYVGEGSSRYREYSSIIMELAETDDVFWNLDVAELFFQQQLSEANGRTFVYSDEDIMTSPISSLCARRLYRLFPSAFVLMIIRNQFTALPSFYANHGAYLRPAPPPYYKRYVSFENWLRFNFDVILYGPIASFDYWRFAEYFDGLFGADRIKILMYEDILHNRNKFCADLGNLLNIDHADVKQVLETFRERKRVSSRALNFHRLLSILIGKGIKLNEPLTDGWLGQRFAAFVAGGTPVESVIPASWIDRIARRYAEGNVRLAVKYRLPLKAYGYPM